MVFFYDFSVPRLRSADSDFLGCIYVSCYFGSLTGFGDSFGAREIGILEDKDFYCDVVVLENSFSGGFWNLVYY